MQTQVVGDVHAHPDHITCDSDTRSEIVVPVLSGMRLVAVIDVDSAVENTFGEVDRECLEKLATLLGEGCDW